MNRRKFLELAGVGTAATLTHPAFASLFRAPDSPSADPASKPYGSGHFGEWFTDDYDLPAYRYTCDQLSDPRARTLTHADILAPNDHLHLVGNNRVVGVASNFGHIQVRQDEGAPKYLNDYAPAEGLHGAGIGWLTDGNEVVSTHYPGDPARFERIFGLGYLRKIAHSAGYTADQTIFAPYGDDPALISLVTITNHSAKAANLRWVEYWGASNYQFSYRARMETDAVRDSVRCAARRRNFARRFEHNFELAGNRGLLERQRFLGRDPEEEALWQKMLAAKQAPGTAPGASFDDLNPPPTFLVSLDGSADGYATDASVFFGSGGILHPAGLAQKLPSTLTAKGPESAHILERAFTLEPGRTKTIAFLYGYLPEGFTLAELTERYAEPGHAFAQSSARWKREGIQFRTPAEPWVEREIAWHNYYLRGALTYDSFFREHIISQGCVYQHVLGFQGAARDPLQHVLPFLFSDPDLVRQVIRYTLKEIQPDGSLPYALVGAGVPMPSEFLPSDQELWLLWVLAEYVLATRDKAFLNERIPMYPRHDLRPHRSRARYALLPAFCGRHRRRRARPCARPHGRLE
jgi:hypothetical protein